jgi:hypothetical protein
VKRRLIYLDSRIFQRHQGGAWLLSEAIGMDATLRLPSLDVQIPLAGIYAKVPFGAVDPIQRDRPWSRTVPRHPASRNSP